MKSLRQRTLLLAAVSISCTAVLAQEFGAPDFDVSWHTTDSGGGTAVAGDFELVGTIGQHDAGGSFVGGDFELVGGFWSVGAIVPCPGDITGDSQVNVDDLLQVINNWGVCVGCPADVNDDDVVNVDDLLQIISSWGACA